ncbi:LOW QUALITY PROTEIN: protein DMR6-LIKE OXYGENASE 2-like [Carica papaya]|uniref:LOW QUALITY PROTEIN: protein DMR6-LIKE OXYGENASE 2-like n=1 Tax=Carica papaya TaxID=3649 RepID=UPI000B8D1B87|nr:LOW QUALITY PROTEIN: protein DMR6-LIKE OXYGENASE 2-like [Carica papaya]
MAGTVSASIISPPKVIKTVKALTESAALTSLPSAYAFSHPHGEAVSDLDSDESIPVIDYSLLTSGTPGQRSKIIEDLAKACRDWGFFMVTNHGVEERLMEEMIEACKGFFNLSEEEKQEYAGKHVLDTIRCGTSMNVSVDQVLFWRDYLKIFVHPQFNSPNKPPNFREIASDYTKRVREIREQLLIGIWESLGLDGHDMNKALNIENGLLILAANLYPPCPQPELAIGLPPHSDHGLLTILIQNGIGGLQLECKGKWVNVNAIPNSFLVNICDNLEILSNGKYKSVVHRALVNNRSTRISIAMANGPALDTVVSPIAELVEKEGQSPAYFGIKYRDYLELQQSNKLDRKSCLDRVRIQPC